MSEIECSLKYAEIKKKNPFWSTADIVYETLLEAIIYHRLKPGSKVRQEELAERMCVSRSPVREAIARLEKDNYIEKIPGKGYCVYQLKIKDYMQMIELRCALESLGAKLSAERQTAKEQKEMSIVIEKLNEARQNNDHETMLELDHAFHSLIIEHSKNQYLKDVYGALSPQIIFFRHFVVGEQFYLSIYQRHKGIYDAMLNRNENLASERLTRHLMVSLEKAL